MSARCQALLAQPPVTHAGASDASGPLGSDQAVADCAMHGRAADRGGATDRPSAAGPPSVRWRSPLIVGAAAAALSIASFAYFFSKGMTNVYGDGVAHVNIARKVVDSPETSLWRRYIQIGSPWLPLQTVLMLPLVQSDWMWRTAVAGSVISMLSFVVTALALFLISRRLYGGEVGRYSKVLPFVAAGVFALNPSALYLQATPMTEMLFMATVAVAVLLLQRWSQSNGSGALALAAVAMSLATLSRYEAWMVAALAIPLVGISARGGPLAKLKSATLFLSIVLAGPAYWLLHNWAIYRDPLEFLTGPNSARGIYSQNSASLGWSKIFVGHMSLDVALMLLAVAVVAGPLVLLAAGAGLFRLILRRPMALAVNGFVLLLLAPFVFHTVGLYRGEIQLFPLSAFGLLNVRYGLPHLLPVALLAPAAVPFFSKMGRARAVAAACLILAAQYGLLLCDGPSELAIYQEGYRNGLNTKQARERGRVAQYLKEHPARPNVLMHTGALGPIVPAAGLRFAEVIHEGTSRWHQVTESIPPDVSTVVVQEGDPLSRRLQSNPQLARDLGRDFREEFAAGSIKVFEREARSP